MRLNIKKIPRRSILWAPLLNVLLWNLVTLFFPQSTFASSLPSVIRLANGEWPPYTGRDLPSQGCDSQVVVEAFALEGIQVEYEFLPWARGLLLSQNGEFDGAIEWADTPEHRQTHIVSEDVLSQQQWVFFRRKDNRFSWKRLDDLKDKTIGLTIGYAYSDVFTSLKIEEPTMFNEAKSDLLNFKKLLNGRIDFFPIERAVGYHYINKYFSPEERAELEEIPVPLAKFTPHLLLSRTVPENEHRMKLFDRGLKRLKAGTRYQEIMNQCFPEAR